MTFFFIWMKTSHVSRATRKMLIVPFQYRTPIPCPVPEQALRGDTVISPVNRHWVAHGWEMRGHAVPVSFSRNSCAVGAAGTQRWVPCRLLSFWDHHRGGCTRKPRLSMPEQEESGVNSKATFFQIGFDSQYILSGRLCSKIYICYLKTLLS